MKKIFSVLLISLAFFITRAQGNDVEMADGMRSNGKIYVVIAVIVTILAVLILYLVRLDRRISKLEKNN